MAHSTRSPIYRVGSTQERLCHQLATRLFRSLSTLSTDHPLVKLDSTEWPTYVVEVWCGMIQRTVKKLGGR